MALDRIVVINDSSVARGGATGLALLSVNLLAARGLPITLICGDQGVTDLPGVEVVALGSARLLERSKASAMRHGLWHSAAQAHVADWIATHDTQGTVYHVHSWAQIFSPALFRALAPVAPRVVTHAHDFFLACPSGVFFDYRAQELCTRVPLSRSCVTCPCDKRSNLQKVWRLGRHGLLHRSLAGADWGPVAMIHPEMRPALERGGLAPERLRVLRNPASAYTSERVRAERNVSALFVGRVERDKGAVLLAEAAGRLGMPLSVVGDGPALDEVRAANPAAQLKGWRDKSEIGAIAREARVLVMPSLNPEPFGLVAAEAVLSGVPVVLADRALMSREVEAQGVGMAFRSGQLDSLMDALARIRSDDAFVHAASLRAHSGTTRLSLSPAAWVDGLIDIYNDIT